jgi:hypothetical protein
VPSKPGSKTSEKKEFASNLHQGYLRHLFVTIPDTFKGLKKPKVALNHFHEDVLILNSKREAGAFFLRTISSKLALAIGLTLIDKVSGSGDYFNLPNQSISQMEAFTATKLGQSQARTPGTVPRGTATKRLSFTDKKDLRSEVERKKKMRIATVENKAKLAVKVTEERKIRKTFDESQKLYIEGIENDHEKEINRLKSQIYDMQSQLDENDELNLQFKEKIENFNMMITNSGLNRITILDAVWHTNNPEMCQHLFGFHNLKEYQVYVSCFFTNIALQTCLFDGIFRNVNITEYEKCTMVMLRMRRRFPLDVIGLIFDRDRTSIGRYIDEWAPRWEFVGV